MTSPGIHIDKALAHTNVGESIRRRISKLLVRARLVAGTAAPWVRQHQNWLWLALAALLGLTYLYFLFAGESPRWH